MHLHNAHHKLRWNLPGIDWVPWNVSPYFPIARTHTAFFTLVCCWTANNVRLSQTQSVLEIFPQSCVYASQIRCVRVFSPGLWVSVPWVGLYGRDIDVGCEIVYIIELLCQQRILLPNQALVSRP